MALSLNQVKKSKSVNSTKAPNDQLDTREPREEVKKVRPWQNPSEVPPTPPTQGELQEWLKAAEALKNKGLSQLPSEVRVVIENSWLGKVQLAPRIRIPIPSIFVTKERP